MLLRNVVLRIISSYADAMDVPAPDMRRLAIWLAAQPEIIAAWLFGSRARGDARADSDVDVAVLTVVGGNPGSLRRRLEWKIEAARAMGQPQEAVDLILLEEASPLLVHAVLRGGRLLVDSRPGDRIAFEEAALHRFVVAARLRDEAMAARAERLAGSGRDDAR